MTIDALIPLSYRPPKFDTISDAAEQTQTMRQMLEEMAMRKAYVIGEDGKVNRDATRANLMRVNPQFGLQQDRQWDLNDKWDESARLREEQIKASTENAKLKRLGLFTGDIKKRIGNVSGMLLMGGDPEQARQALMGDLMGLMDQYKMNEQERAGLLRDVGLSEGFDPERLQAVATGKNDARLMQIAEYLENRGRLPQAMTDEGDVVGGAAPQDGEYVAAAGQPVADESKWYGRAPKSEEDWKKWGALRALGQSNKWFKGNEAEWSIPGMGVTVDNPYYWRNKERDYKLKSQYKVGTGSEVNVYPNGALKPGTVAGNKVDEGILESTARLQRLSAIESSYKPEYLKVGTRLGNTWSKIKEKAGVDLSGEDQKSLREFSQWKRQSLENLNQYVKEITGAAMTDAEAGRIRAALPDPGQNFWDGDSPTEFKSKLDDVTRQIKMAEARFVYIKRNGMSIEGVPLERMPQIMNARGAAMERELRQKNPKMDTKTVQNTVKRALAQEFGLASD
jgi:hypothetical protein